METILEPDKVGRMRAGYQDYGQLIEQLGRREHQSCVLLTSRGVAAVVVDLEQQNSHVRSLSLDGLDIPAGQGLLRDHGLHVEENRWRPGLSRPIRAIHWPSISSPRPFMTFTWRRYCISG